MKKDVEWYEAYWQRLAESPTVANLVGYRKESEEIEVKNFEWLKEKIGELPCVDAVFNSDGSSYIDSAVPVMAVYDLIDELDEPEVLSEKWIGEHRKSYTMEDSVEISDLQNLLVPKQELPVIPKYVGEFIEEAKGSGDTLDDAFSILTEIYHQSEAADWLAKEKRNSEIFARAWLDGYKVEEEPIYYALIKGHELSSDNLKYWHCEAYHLGRVLIGAKHPKQRCINRMTKKNWKIYGINESNADFEEVQG